MDAPTFSTFSAIAEIFVTLGVMYVIFRSYRQIGFASKVAAAVIVFEFSVNMMYMISRMRDASGGHEQVSSTMALFMAAHGILSLVVFVLFVVYSYLAHVAWKRGKHFFWEHKGITWSYVFLWGLSVGSGEILYAINYL